MSEVTLITTKYGIGIVTHMRRSVRILKRLVHFVEVNISGEFMACNAFKSLKRITVHKSLLKILYTIIYCFIQQIIIHYAFFSFKSCIRYIIHLVLIFFHSTACNKVTVICIDYSSTTRIYLHMILTMKYLFNSWGTPSIEKHLEHKYLISYVKNLYYPLTQYKVII